MKTVIPGYEKTMTCPVLACNFKLRMPFSDALIAHLQDRHVDYLPRNKTLERFDCMRCAVCGIVAKDHECREVMGPAKTTATRLVPIDNSQTSGTSASSGANQSPVQNNPAAVGTTGSSRYKLPSPDNYMNTVDVSWTVTVTDGDIPLLLYKKVCNLFIYYLFIYN